MPEQMGGNHSWTWTSHLPLECAPQSVTLTYWYNNTSSRAKQTLPGRFSLISLRFIVVFIAFSLLPSFSSIVCVGVQFSKVELFPKDKVFRVGSEATFCCMVPPGDSFTNMSIDDKSGTNMGIGRISSQVYAMTVLFKDARGSLIDVTCETNKTDAGTGTVVDCEYCSAKSYFRLCSFLKVMLLFHSLIQIHLLTETFNVKHAISHQLSVSGV